MTIRDYFNKQKWTFAKTYANKAPHYWIISNRAVGGEKEFMWAMEYIKRHGATMYYYGHENKYIYLDGWWYWALPCGGGVYVINRCLGEDYYVSTKWKGSMK